MNKLHRIRSTDLTVLRSILNDETDNNWETSTDANQEESTNKEMSTHSDGAHLKTCENGNSKDNKNEKPILSTKTFTPGKPFIITRIESKHKSNIANTKPNLRKSSINLYSSQNEFPVYQGIHYKNIVEKENRLEKKYQQLYQVLNQDILMKTVSLCDQYINDGRQLVQNSLATSRIVSSFIEDMSKCQGRRFKQSTNSPLEHVNLNYDSALSSAENQSKSFGYFPENSLIRTRESISLPPSDCKATRTNHVLDSEKPFIRQWLERKNRQLNLEKQIKREEDKIENAISIGAIAVEERRKAEADEAFKKWKATKKIRQENLNDDMNGSTDGSDSEVGLPQAGRQPKPSSGKPRRPTTFLLKPNSSATFAMHRNIKMKVTGQPVSLISSETFRPATQVDLSCRPFRKTDVMLMRDGTAVDQSKTDVMLMRPGTAVDQSKTDVMPMRPGTAFPQSRKVKDLRSISQPVFQKHSKKKHKIKKNKPTNHVRKVEDLEIEAEEENLEFYNLETSEIMKGGERKEVLDLDVESKDYQCSWVETDIGKKVGLQECIVTNGSNEISDDLSTFSDEEIQ